VFVRKTSQLATLVRAGSGNAGTGGMPGAKARAVTRKPGSQSALGFATPGGAAPNPDKMEHGL